MKGFTILPKGKFAVKRGNNYCIQNCDQTQLSDILVIRVFAMYTSESFEFQGL